MYCTAKESSSGRDACLGNLFTGQGEEGKITGSGTGQCILTDYHWWTCDRKKHWEALQTVNTGSGPKAMFSSPS